MNDLIYADNKARMADYDRADRQEDELKKNHDFGNTPTYVGKTFFYDNRE